MGCNIKVQVISSHVVEATSVMFPRLQLDAPLSRLTNNLHAEIAVVLLFLCDGRYSFGLRLKFLGSAYSQFF